MATLNDVAKLAGVDRSTVSRVLRGHPQAARPETRIRVQKAARQLGYRPNALARSLRTRRTNVLALVTPGVDNIGFTGVIHGVQQAAAERGYLVLLADAEALHRDQEMYARLALEGRVDGMLAAFGTTNDPLVRAIVGQGVPVVAVNRQVRGVRAAVVADDYAGARLAVEHLVQAGQRRIAHIAGPSDIDTARRRRRGFLDALAHLGLPQPRGWVVDGDYTETGSRAAAAQLVASQRRTGHIEPPTAVFAASLVSALGAVAGFRDAGLTAPTDMSVITMDEHPVATHLDPPLTTVAMPLVEMGAAAARLLVDMVDGTPARQVSISTPPRLVIRESVVPPPTVSGRQGQPARAERVR